MLRRFFQGFQKRIERGRGQHVYLVDDEHALFALGRRISNILADITDVVNTVVGGSVQLRDIQDRALINAAAGVAAVAGGAVHRIFAVDGLRQDLCRGGLFGLAEPAAHFCGDPDLLYDR
mgnify:CR=1 FL=1